MSTRFTREYSCVGVPLLTREYSRVGVPIDTVSIFCNLQFSQIGHLG